MTFSLIDVVVLLAVALTVVSMVVTSFHERSPTKTVSLATHCASKLKMIHTAMYSYAVNHKDRYPTAGKGDPAASAVGFKEGDRRNGTGAILDNNVTASLWMLVRSGHVSPDEFICPATSDAPDALSVTTVRTQDALLKYTHDFMQRRNLSYSPINMHHRTASQHWSASAGLDRVLLGDNNGNGHAQRHVLAVADAATQKDIENRENSPNHGGEGQNLVFGDGHVEYLADPFRGPGNDNVYAMVTGGVNRPPTLGNSDGDATVGPLSQSDVWLLPLSGNGGVSLSGLKNDVVARRDSTRSVPVETIAVMVVLAGVVTVALFMLWARRHEQPQG